MERVGKKPEMARIPLTFDLTDETQRMVCNLLKSAGYGKRTPIVVKAVCLLMGRANGPEESGAAISRTELSSLVYEAVVNALHSAPLPGPEHGGEAQAEKPARQTQEAAVKGKESAVDRLAEYDLPEDVISSALAFADQFG